MITTTKAGGEEAVCSVRRSVGRELAALGTARQGRKREGERASCGQKTDRKKEMRDGE